MNKKILVLILIFIATIITSTLLAKTGNIKKNEIETKDEIINFWKKTRKQINFIPPTRYDLYQLQDLFLSILQNRKLIGSQESLGWEKLQFGDGHNTVGIRDKRRRGWGAFFYRFKTPSKLVIQTPHTFFDLRTGSIGLKMFLESDAKALIWNTVHRKIVDMSHSPKTILQTFVKTVNQVYSSVVMLQLHGFSPAKRLAQGREVFDFIISECDKEPSPRLALIGECLESKFPKMKVGVYGHSAHYLGGETNLQNHYIRRSFAPIFFVHLEMSSRARIMLDSNKTSRKGFIECFS
jgi:hypothetical protein